MADQVGTDIKPVPSRTTARSAGTTAGGTVAEAGVQPGHYEAVPRPAGVLGGGLASSWSASWSAAWR